MAEQFEQNYYAADANTKVRDLEEKMRLLKDRVILIGQNLIESKSVQDASFHELKSEIEILKREVQKVKEKMQLMSEELDSFSRKEEVALLRKQFRMFEPLQFARIEDVEKIVDEKMRELGRDHSLVQDRRGYIR